MAKLYKPLTRKITALKPLYRRLVSGNPKRAPKEYSVSGVRVHVTVGKEYTKKFSGVIERQVFGGVRALFLVRFKKPVSLYEIVQLMDLKVEEADKFEAELKRQGLITAQEGIMDPGIPIRTASVVARLRPRYRQIGKLVKGMWARWSDLSIPATWLRKGQPIEMMDSEGRDFAVRFIKRLKKKKGRILVWLPEPLTWWDIREMHDWTMVRPEHVSKHQFFIPFKAYKAMYKKGIKLPRARKKKYGGKWLMEFEDSISQKELIQYLSIYAKMTKSPMAHVWSTYLAMSLYHMVPIETGAVTIRPMREDLFYGLVVPVEEAMKGIS
jgi:hypothetical protein